MGLESTVLIIRLVLISGVGDVLWLIIVECVVPVVCVHIRDACTCPKFRGLDKRGFTVL